MKCYRLSTPPKATAVAGVHCLEKISGPVISCSEIPWERFAG